MKKNFIVIISAMSLMLSGCSSRQVDVIINVDGYEGIILATKNTAAPPVSVPAFVSGELNNVIVTAEPTKTTTAPYIEATTPKPVITTASSAETKPPVTSEEEPPAADLTLIMGKSVATADQMRAFIKAVNPDVDQKIIDMIPYYLSEGEAEGVRGDIAFAQSCLETGYFKFEKAGTGSAVTIDDNNFCGLGVTQLGIKGCIFETPQLGIRAQIQHLKAYGSTLPLNGEQVDPRFHYVKRGYAKYWEWLGMQENPEGIGWAGGKNYGPIILEIFYRVLMY